MTVELADQVRTPLIQPAFENGALTGRFGGVSNMPEAQRATQTVVLKVVPVGGELVGQLIAQGMNPDVVFMLPMTVRLRPLRVAP